MEFYEPPKDNYEAAERVRIRIEELEKSIRRESNPTKLNFLRDNLKSNELMLSLLLNEEVKAIQA